VHAASQESKASSIATAAGPPRRLRVLIANEKRDRLAVLAQVVGHLDHDVVAREIYVSEDALELIGEIVREACCPVIALLNASDPAYIREAAKRGIFAYISTTIPTSWRARSTSRCNESGSSSG